MVVLTSDQTGGQETQTGAMGMVVVSDLAIAAGVASIPGPVTDASDDGWYVWQALGGQLDILVGAGPRQAVYEFDSKAMRRIEEGFGVAIVVENAHATHGFNVLVYFSVLASLS